MISILNTDEDPVILAIEEILEICEDPENEYKGDYQAKLQAIRTVATKAIILDERERYLGPCGSC